MIFSTHAWKEKNDIAHMYATIGFFIQIGEEKNTS
jgi:hypothetical protein